jgi:putative DNA primase/helicase
MKYKLSLIQNKTDSFPIDRTFTFEELTKLFTTYTIGTKDSSSAFFAGHFEGTRRRLENLRSRTMLVLDVDHWYSDIPALEAILELSFSKWVFIAYSTFSHTVRAPKCRISLFLSEEIPVNQFKLFATRFIKTLPDELAKAIDTGATVSPCQMYYLPFKPNDNYEEFVKINHDFLTSYINWKDYLGEDEINGKEYEVDAFTITHKNRPLDNLSIDEIWSYLNELDVSNFGYKEWLDVGMALHHQTAGSEEGLNIWDEWSTIKDKENGTNYYQGKSIAKRKWKGFRNDKRNPVTLKSIIYQANNERKRKLQVANSNGMIVNTLVDRSNWLSYRNDKGAPQETIPNLKVLLDHYGISLFYDSIAREEVIYFGDERQTDSNYAKEKIKSLCVNNSYPTGGLHGYLNCISKDKRINQIKEWIESVPWDGKDRLDELLSTVKIREDFQQNFGSLIKTYFKKWLTQVVALNCFNEGDQILSARNVLVFQGEQFIGKTTWLSSLLPFKFRSYIKEGVTLNLDKTHLTRALTCSVFVEIGELVGTFSKSSQEEMKNYISKAQDIFDIKYFKDPEIAKRTVVHFATVNDHVFLRDNTGSTRYWCLPVISCNVKHDVDMQQLYRQLYEQYLFDPLYNLTKEENLLRAKANKEFEVGFIYEDLFNEFFEVEKDIVIDKDNAWSATKLINVLAGIEPRQPNFEKVRQQTVNYLNDKGYPKRTTTPKGWYLPPRREHEI